MLRPLSDGGDMLRLAFAEVPLSVAVIVTDVKAATAEVVIVKPAEVAPAATLTLVGGVAEALLDVRVTDIPPVGAWPFSVTVPVEEMPPVTEFGETTKVLTFGGLTVSTPLAVTPPAVPEIVAAATAATAEVVTVNEADLAPVGTKTLAGGTALVLLDMSVTVTPVDDAGPFSVTVPVDDVPPVTAVGENVMLLGTAEVTVSSAVTDVFPTVAVTVAGVLAETATVATVNVADIAPPGTVTLPGGEAAGLLDDRLTINPPPGAGPLKTMVPVELDPPITDVGAKIRLSGDAGTIERVAVTEVIPCFAVMVAVTEAITGVVVTVKVIEVSPAGINTLLGADALVLLEPS